MNQLVEFLVKPFLTEEQSGGREVIAVVPGGYKPPTLGHYYLVDQVSKKPEVNKTLVLIGHKERDGITKEDALDIWNIYENHLTGDIDIRISDDVSPIKELFSLIGDNPDKYFVLVVGVRSEEDLKDVRRFDNLKKKFDNLEVVQVKGEDAIRGTNARKAILDKDFVEFNRYLPVELTDGERDQVWNILTGEQPVQESYKGKRTNDGAPGTLKAKISKLYGGDVTIEKAKKLKNRKNATAHDKRQANWFINFHSKNENIIPTEDEPAAPYGSGYKKLKEDETKDRADFYLDYFTNVSPSTFMLERQGDDIYISNIFADYPEGFDDKHTRQIPVDQQMEKTLMPYITSLTGYMVENGLSIGDAPEVHFVDDPKNAEELFGRTAFYDPNEKSITLYVTGRHPKDILRSFAHEMIHYCQDCEDRLHHTYTTDVNEDDRLMELEREAYERGNMYFRSWENSLNEDDRKGIKAYSLELAKGLEENLKETKSRYNVPVKDLVKKIFTAWKDQYGGKEGIINYSDNAGSLTSKTGNTFYFELDANLKVEETPDQIYAVEEPTGVDPDIDPEEGDPTFDINIKVDPRDLPKKWPDIYYDLIDIVRHEIEHLTHFGPDAIDVKRLPDDKILRMLIDDEFLPKADYFRLTAEVDAMLQGMALKAKKKKEPFAKTLNDYLDIQIDNRAINQEEKEDILNLWRKRAPALSLPKF